MNDNLYFFQAMTSSRVPYVAARQNQFPRFLSMIHVSFLTPVPAVILNGIVATLAVLQSNLNQLINYFSFAMWIFHTMTCLAVIVLRKLKERFNQSVFNNKSTISYAAYRM